MEHFQEAIQTLVSKLTLLEEQRRVIDDQAKRIKEAINLLRLGEVVQVPYEHPENKPNSKPNDTKVDDEQNSTIADSSGRYPDIKVILSQKYNPQANWRDRVLYAIAELGNAYVTDIVNFIYERQPELDPSFLHRKITRVASDLSAMHVVKAEKEGNKNRYSTW